MEIREAYQKLFERSTKCYFDTTRWRLPTIRDVCSASNIRLFDEESPYPGKDERSENMPARKAFPKLRKYSTLTMKEASISSLIRFDAITYNTKRSFGLLLQSSKDWINTVTGIVKVPLHDKFQPYWTREGGSITHRKAPLLTKIFLVATSSLLYHCLQIFKECLRPSHDPLGNALVKLGVSTESTPEEGLK